MIRSILSSVVEGVIKRFSGSGRLNETLTDREYFQHFGFTSIPLAGAEGIAINENNNIIMIASDDRRCRPALQPGEACVYNAFGDYVKIDKNRNITVVGGTSVTIQSPAVTIEGINGGQVDLTINGNPAITGNLSVTGNITATGSITGNPVVNG